jgi:hypothetical protein
MSKNPDLEELFITVKEQDSDDEQSTPMVTFLKYFQTLKSSSF